MSSICTESCKTLLPANVVNKVEEALNILLINNTRSFATQAPVKTSLSLGALALGVALSYVAIWKRKCRVSTEEDKTTIVFALVFLWMGFEATMANARIILSRYDLTVGAWILETIADPLIGMLVLFVVYRKIVHSLPTCSNPALERLDSVLFQTLLAVPPVLQFLRVLVESCESSAATGITMLLSMGLILLLFFSYERVVRAAPSPEARTRVLGVLFGVYVVLQRFLTWQERFVKHVQILRAQKIAYNTDLNQFKVTALVRDSADRTDDERESLWQQYVKLWNVFDNRSERGSKIVSYLQPAANVSDVMVLSLSGQQWLNGLGEQKSEIISQWWHSILPDPKQQNTFAGWNENASRLVLLATIMVREQNAVNSVLFWKLFLDWFQSKNSDPQEDSFVLERFLSSQNKEQRNEWFKSHRLSTRFEPNERQQRQFRRFLVNHVICKSSDENPVLTEYLEKDVSVPRFAQVIIITATSQLSTVPTARRGSLVHSSHSILKDVQKLKTDDFDSDASCANLLWLWYSSMCLVVLFPVGALVFLLRKRMTIIQDSSTVLYLTLGWAILTNILMHVMTRQVMEEGHVGVEEEEKVEIWKG